MSSLFSVTACGKNLNLSWRKYNIHKRGHWKQGPAGITVELKLILLMHGSIWKVATARVRVIYMEPSNSWKAATFSQVLCPPQMYLLGRNSLVNEVEFLAAISKK